MYHRVVFCSLLVEYKHVCLKQVLEPGSTFYIRLERLSAYNLLHITVEGCCLHCISAAKAMLLLNYTHTYLVTYFSFSCLDVARKVRTRSRQYPQSSAPFATLPHVSPAAFSSFSMVRIHVDTGVPPFHFPSGIQVNALLLVDHR